MSKQDTDTTKKGHKKDELRGEDLRQAWKESGRSQRAYAESQGMALSRFKYLQKQPQKSDKTDRVSGFKKCELRTSPSRLQVRPLQPVNTADAIPYCEVRFYGDHHIRINSPEALLALRDMVGVMSQ